MNGFDFMSLNPYPEPKLPKRLKKKALDEQLAGIDSFSAGLGSNPYPQGTISHALIENPALSLVLAAPPIAFHRCYLLLMGDRREAVRDAWVLGKIIEYGRTLEPAADGWFTMGSDDWAALLDLSYGHHLAARNALVEMGLLHKHVTGKPPEYFYKLNDERLNELLIELGNRLACEQAAKVAAVVRH